tara:strand:+ start:5253 stop:5528 length:276 start_codon:yes stop_codon:yes gene_type:complete
MNTQNIAELIKSTKGKFFSVEFVKRDGSVRKMTARLGVRKGITGKGLAFNPAERDLMVVWATDKKNYRMINLRTINTIKFNGVVNNFNNTI